MNLSNPISVVIIGLGHIARYHIQALRSNKNFELIGVCDRNPDCFGQLEISCRTYTNMDKCLEDLSPQLVIIATPNNTHYTLSKKALQAGCHVMVEKPSAQSLREINELEDLARERKWVYYHAFHAAYAREVLWFLKKYEDSAFRSMLGPLTSFASNFYDPYIEDGMLRDGAQGLDNCWIDSGVNALSVLDHFVDLEKMDIERSSFTKVPTISCNIIQGLVHFSFPVLENMTDRSGHGFIDTNWTLRQNFKITKLYFAQTGHSITLNHSEQSVSKVNERGEKTTLFDCNGEGERLLNHYHGVFSDLSNALRKRIGNKAVGQRINKLLFSAINL